MSKKAVRYNDVYQALASSYFRVTGNTKKGEFNDGIFTLRGINVVDDDGDIIEFDESPPEIYSEYMNRDSNLMLKTTRLEDKAYVKFILSRVEIEATSPRLGFVNYNHVASYVYSLPRRQFCFGLSRDTMNIEHVGIDVRKLPMGNPRKLCTYEEAAKFLFNPEYPTYEDSLEAIITGEDVSSAFHYDWAVGILSPEVPYIQLMYKRDVVGFVDEVDFTPRLHEDAEHLKEQLQSVVGNVEIVSKLTLGGLRE